MSEFDNNEFSGNVLDPKPVENGISKIDDALEGFINKKADKGLNKQAFEASGLKSTSGLHTEENVSAGAYNKLDKSDKAEIKQASYDKATEPVKQTDAYQAYDKISNTARLFGTSAVDQYTNAHNQLGIKMRTGEGSSTGIMGYAQDGVRPKEIIKFGKGGDALSRFNANSNAIDSYLVKKNINPASLKNSNKIERAISTGQLGSKKLDANDIIALQHKLFYVKNKSLADMAQKQKDAKFGTTKAWMHQTLGQTDASKGFSTAKTAYSTSKILYKGTMGTIGGIGSAIVSTPSAALKIGKVATTGASKVTGLAGKALNNEKLKKFSVAAGKSSEKIAVNIGRMANGSVGKVNIFFKKFAKFTPSSAIKSGARKVTGKAGEKIAKTAIGNAVGGFFTRYAIIARLRNVGKIISTPVRVPMKILGTLKKAIGKVALLFGGILFALVLIGGISGGLISAFMSDDTSGNEGTEHDSSSIMQITIDNVYEKQCAYQKNEYMYREGDALSVYGIPKKKKNWVLYRGGIGGNKDLELTNTIDAYAGGGSDGVENVKITMIPVDTQRNYDLINDVGNVVYKNGSTIVGYDLSKYWGKALFKYEADIPVYNEIQDGVNEDNSPHYIYEKSGEHQHIELIGGAGLWGPLGTYDLSELTHYTIPESNTVYARRAGLSNTVRPKYRFFGSSMVEFDNYETDYEISKSEAEDPEIEESDLYYFGYTHSEDGDKYYTGCPEVEYRVGSSLDETIAMTAADETLYEKAQYDLQDIYHSLVALEAGVMQNATYRGTEGFLNFSKLYCNQIFDEIVDTAKLQLDTEYMITGDREMTVNINQTFPSGATLALNTVSWQHVYPEFTLNTAYRNVGLADMVNFSNFPEANETLANFADPTKNPHIKPYKPYVLYDLSDGNKTIWWNTLEHNKMSENYEYAVDIFSYELKRYDGSFAYFYEGVDMPIYNPDIFDLMEMWEDFTYDPEMFDEETLAKILSGEISLDNFMSFYVKQFGIQDQIGIKNLCNFTSYLMMIMYMNPEQASYIKSHAADLAREYCDASGLCYNSDLLAHFGMTRTSQHHVIPGSQESAESAVLQIKAQLEAQKPVLIHCYGQWSGANGTYHVGNGQHYMVVCGASEEGALIADPAGTATGKIIPWGELTTMLSKSSSNYGNMGYTMVSK